MPTNASIFSPSCLFDFDEVWCDITDVFGGSGEIFGIKQIIGKLPSIEHLGAGSQRDIIRFVLKSVEEQGNDQVTRLGGKCWKLAS